MKLIDASRRYWHTLRHLKPVQFYGRLWFRLRRPRLDLLAAPLVRPPQGGWLPPAKRNSSMSADASFCFLNHSHSLPAQGGWNDTRLEKLWLYNLHYFDDLNARGAPDRASWHRPLMQRWVAENPPVSGNGWEPYPTSLRIVNWVKWLATGNAAPPGIAQSLATQARWLSRRLEWHLLGNHLFANAKALVFAGLFFDGPEAAGWLVTGLKIIARELPEQVLADGGNFERSPMYHAIFLEDLLDLINAGQCWPELVPDAQLACWREAAGRMLIWLAGMTHPDGEIALFNDAAFGVAPGGAELIAYAMRLGVVHGSPRRFAPRDDEDVVIASEARQSMPTVLHFAESGYVRLQNQDAVALLDVAPIGPDYLPGHAHADTLTFELSVFGQRVVVDSGTSRYGLGAERSRQRGTAAHNTVEVDGADSSEVWGGFRVARRAKPFGLVTTDDDEALTVTCAHDGYRRLPGKPIHRRRWRLNKNSLQVSDVIEGSFRTAVARYYLHPAVSVTGTESEGQLHLPDGRVLRWSAVGGKARVVSASWHPEFGLTIPCKRIEVLFEGAQARFEFAWE